MIKVKGQVCHVVMSLNDTSDNIRDLAKLFFLKLSERSNNPVYNLLGDIISIFSQESNSTEHTTDQQSVINTDNDGVEVAQLKLNSNTINNSNLVLSAEQFQSTMHFMLSFVKKDK